MATHTTIDLSAWCDHDPEPSRYRYKLNEPFVVDGWRYATDVRRIIRVPAPGEPDTEGNLPKAAVVFAGWPELDSLPESVPIEMGIRDCPTCDGDGYATREPCICEGGECRCDCGNEHDCHLCRGTGMIGRGKCATCLGEKQFEQPHLVEIGGTTIDARYFELVKLLPGPVQFGVKKQNSEGHLVMFRFEAAIMELRRGAAVLLGGAP